MAISHKEEEEEEEEEEMEEEEKEGEGRGEGREGGGVGEGTSLAVCISVCTAMPVYLLFYDVISRDCHMTDLSCSYSAVYYSILLTIIVIWEIISPNKINYNEH